MGSPGIRPSDISYTCPLLFQVIFLCISYTFPSFTADDIPYIFPVISCIFPLLIKFLSFQNFTSHQINMNVYITQDEHYPEVHDCTCSPCRMYIVDYMTQMTVHAL